MSGIIVYSVITMFIYYSSIVLRNVNKLVNSSSKTVRKIKSKLRSFLLLNLDKKVASKIRKFLILKTKISMMKNSLVGPKMLA